MEPSLTAAWPDTSGWSELLADCLADARFQELDAFVSRQRGDALIFPPAAQVFEAFRRTPLDAVRVVVLGQDPYHGPGQAHGLSFSVPAGAPFPPSLRNLLREWQSDLGLGTPASGNLQRWADQGVLLLNTVLTVRAGEAHSHAGQGWEWFTDCVIERLARRAAPIVFALLGKHAQEKQCLIAPPHAAFTAPHPSPLSAHRGFFGSRPFSRINEMLVERGRPPIDWALD